MAPLGTLLLIFPLLGDGARIDVAAAVDAQTGAGVLPLLPDEPSTFATDSALVLLSGLRASSERTTWELSYRPRFVLQVPNPSETVRPLLLHQLLSTYQSNLTNRTSLQISALASAGEVTYLAQQQVFSPGTAPAAGERVPLALGTLSTNLSHSTSERNRVSLGLSSGYSAPLDSSEAAALVFPESFDAGAALSDAYRVTPQDQFEFTSRAQYFNISQFDLGLEQNIEISTWGGSVTWTHQASERTSVGITAGGAVAYSLLAQEVGFIPEGTLLHVTGWRADRTIFSSTLNGGVRGFLDRLAGTYNPQGFVAWNFNASIGRDWTTGMNAFASTSLAGQPVDPPQYETFGSLEQPTAYRISKNAQIRFGVRASVRSAYLWEEANEPLRPQPEAIGFVGFRYGLGTDQQEGAWLR
jgi:hypothetical protein